MKDILRIVSNLGEQAIKNLNQDLHTIIYGNQTRDLNNPYLNLRSDKDQGFIDTRKEREKENA